MNYTEKNTSPYTHLEEILSFKFKNIAILKQALTHRSYLNESKEKGLESNERLEFLGDAVLQFVSSEYIYQKFPDFNEGELTNLRAKIVNTESLATESRKLKLHEYLLISKGEKETASTSSYILANAFESTIGAIYLDQGIDRAKEFISSKLFYKIKDSIDSGELKDPKSLYQEYAQERFNITPTYKVINETGPDHSKEFVMGLYLNDRLIAKGSGSSKRKAQQEAAKRALDDKS